MALAGALVLVALFFALTSSEPLAGPRRDATAEQVVIGHTAFELLKSSRSLGHPVTLAFRQRELDAVAALLTQGFKPNRFAARLVGNRLEADISRPFLGRWLNIHAAMQGEHTGFPPIAVKVGAIPLPNFLVQSGARAARWLLNQRAANIPPLDRLVAHSRIADGVLVADLFLPRTGPIRAALGGGETIDGVVVTQIYCSLARAQRTSPDPLIAHQLSRALAASPATPAGHGAALVALAMLAVDPSIADSIDGAVERSAACQPPATTYTLQGRSDSPKHWSLSAALSVLHGQHLSEALGEWKELSDSLAKNPYLAPNDLSGFSFVDLATDRAGFLTARALLDPDRLQQVRARLLRADDDQLLPRRALRLSDGMPNAQFVARYGATDDPRFATAVSDIDTMLKADGIE